MRRDIEKVLRLLIVQSFFEYKSIFCSTEINSEGINFRAASEFFRVVFVIELSPDEKAL